MSRYYLKFLDRSDNREMLGILRSAPITTDNIKLCFDRQPDIFRMAEIKYKPYSYLGFFHESILEGFVMIGYHTTQVNGNPETVFHFTDYYIRQEGRSKGFSYNISDYLFKETYNNARLGYGIIMEGNKEALSLLGRRHPRYPFVPWTRIINKLDVKTILLAFPVKPDNTYTIRHATFEDIPIIVSLLNEEHKNRLFGNSFSESSFKHLISSRPDFSINNYYLAMNGLKRIVGVSAAWDCSSFKQNRVIKYGTTFMPSRIGYWLLSKIYGLPPLPGEGQIFKDVTITDYAVKDRNPAIMEALLRAVYRDYRKLGYHSMIWGSSADDPILKAAKTFFHQDIISNIVLLSLKPELIDNNAIKNRFPYIDIACL
jgi:hypothetical protein